MSGIDIEDSGLRQRKNLRLEDSLSLGSLTDSGVYEDVLNSPCGDVDSAGYKGKKLSNLIQKFDELAIASSFISTKANEAVKIRFTKDEEEPIKPITVMTLFKRALETFPDHQALVFQASKNAPWESHTFREYYELCRTAAKSFIKCGLKVSNGVGILGFNSTEWFISYMGGILAGGLAAGIYATNGPESCLYVLKNACCNVVVVENNVQLQKILSIWDRLPELKAIVQYRGPLQKKLPNVYTWEEFLKLGCDVPEGELESRWLSQAPNKCCTLIYTSGTTGDSKGVMLSHDNLIWTATVCGRQAKLVPCDDVLVSYLPLSHVAAQILDMFIPLVYGATIYFAQPDALKGSLGDTLKVVHPTVFLGVPRVWEKMQEKIISAGKSQGLITRTIVGIAKYIGYWGNMSLMNGGSVPYGWTLANLLVFWKVRKALGLERCRFCLTAAAPIMKDTLDFFMSLNLPLMEIYGMSESSGPHTISFPWKYRTVSSGVELKGSQTKLMNKCDESGEVCMNGRNVFMGYMNMAEKTKEAFTEDEVWLRSGDVGRKDQDGFLYITGRIKELIITAGGENVAPIPIEDAIKELLPCISNCMLVGDRKKFLSMLITLKTEIDPVSLAPLDDLHPSTLEWCRKIGLPDRVKTLSQLLENINPSVAKAMQMVVDKANAKAVSRAQFIQKWSILPRDFSICYGELGPTLKLKRMVVADLYKSTIDAFYTSSD